MVTIILIIWNLLVFALFGIDKKRAVCKKWRIQEKTLILCAFFMGGPGALFGMRIFHHKTRKMLFKILIPAATFFNALVFEVVRRNVLWIG